MNYSKGFREEAIKLSDEIGIKKAASQLGIPYYTLADWRKRYQQKAVSLRSFSRRVEPQALIYTF